MKVIMLMLLFFTTIVPAYAENTFSVELLAGSATQKTYDDSISLKGSDPSFGVRVAYGHDRGRFELAYQTYGEAQDRIVFAGVPLDNNIRTTSINFGVKGKYPLQDKVSFVGRIGLAKWNWAWDIQAVGAPTGSTYEDDGISFYWGVGMQYDYSNNIFLGAEFFGFNADLDIEGERAKNRVQNLSLAIGKKF